MIGIRRPKGLKDLPPGPVPSFVLGNIFDLPPKGMPEFRHWLTHREKYGPITSVTLAGQTIVHLHDRQAADSLLGEGSSISSGRPQLEFSSRMCGFGELVALQDYDDSFRRRRRLIHRQLGTSSLAARFNAAQEEAVARLLLVLLDEPNSAIQHIRLAVSSIILKITYGYSVVMGKPDPLVMLIERMAQNASIAAVPLAWPVDIIPLLKLWPDWLPGSGFKRKAREFRDLNEMVISTPYRFVREQIAAQSNQLSFVSHLIEQDDQTKDGSNSTALKELDLKWAAATMYLGGTDTTSIALKSFILAMVLYPGAQAAAQDEIDKLTGGNRLPLIEDQKELPYINAMVKEVLRWSPVLPIGIPHVVRDETEVQGYRVPQGSFVFPSIWWFAHDPEIYKDPDEFIPERFLKPRHEPDPRDFVFGYGRRVCPGRYMAENLLLVAIARILAVFKISRATDENGIEILPKLQSAGPGLVNQISDFPYRMAPRTLEAAILVSDPGRELLQRGGDAVLLDPQVVNEVMSWVP